MYLKISKFLSKLSFKLRQKSLYYELRHYILSNESYLKPVDYYQRGIGKTYTLLKLAHKLDLPIAVPNESTARNLRRMNEKLYDNPIEIFCVSELSRGRRFHTILCEEGITRDRMKLILEPMCKQIVGYVNRY